MATAFGRKQFSGNENFTVAMVERPSHLAIGKRFTLGSCTVSIALIVPCFKAATAVKG